MTYQMLNFNMMNYNNGWGGLLQSGLNMFAQNGMGIGMGSGSWGTQIGSIWGNNILGGGNMFTNCLGEIDYDKMAGFGVANALIGVSAQAFQSVRAQKQEQKQDIENASDRIAQIDNEVSDLKDTNVEETIDQHFDVDIASAVTNRSTAKTNLDNANQTLQELNSQLAAADKTEKAGIEAKIEKAQADVEKYQKEYDKYNGDEKTEGSVKYCEAKKAEAIEAKQKEINNKIKELEAEKAELLDKVSKNAAEKAKGRKWQRASQEEYNNVFDDNGKLKTDAKVDDSIIRYAYTGFINAKDDTEKKKWANQVKQIYLALDENDKNKSIRNAYAYVRPYAD